MLPTAESAQKTVPFLLSQARATISGEVVNSRGRSSSKAPWSDCRKLLRISSVEEKIIMGLVSAHMKNSTTTYIYGALSIILLACYT